MFIDADGNLRIQILNLAVHSLRKKSCLMRLQATSLPLSVIYMSALCYETRLHTLPSAMSSKRMFLACIIITKLHDLCLFKYRLIFGFLRM